MSLKEDPRHGVGARLKAERERIGMTQEGMGKAVGTTKQTQLRYENGMNSPTSSYLHELTALGVDIGYVLTGYPSELRDDEAEMLSRYRGATAELRAAALAVLATGPRAGAASSVAIGGDNLGQVMSGTFDQSGMTFNVGSRGTRSRKKPSK